MSATAIHCTDTPQRLHMAMELSTNRWVLAFSTGVACDPRIRQVFARDWRTLRQEIKNAREKFGLPEETPVVSCYEAGRDGFWIHRCLQQEGIENVIIDASSIEQSRRQKRVKTDRVDAQKLVRLLCRACGGERDVYRTVCVPSDADEDHRHLHRELRTLKGNRTRQVNRIRAILCELGLDSRVPLDKSFSQWLEGVSLWNGQPVPPGARARLLRQIERLKRCDEEIRELEQERRELIRTDQSRQAEQVRRLLSLKAIGETTSWLLVAEMFGWRTFKTRKQVGSFTGLVNAPYDTGQSQRDQGITKAGNKWIRGVMIEIAWMWLRHQPQSELSEWYDSRFGGPGKRVKKIGIVALARKLTIALWRYLEKGIPPAGAILVPWYTKVRLKNDPTVASAAKAVQS